MLVSPDDATNCFIFRVVMPSLELNGHVLKFTRGSHANPQITTVRSPVQHKRNTSKQKTLALHWGINEYNEEYTHRSQHLQFIGIDIPQSKCTYL